MILAQEAIVNALATSDHVLVEVAGAIRRIPKTDLLTALQINSSATIERAADGSLNLKEGSVEVKHLHPDSLGNGLLTNEQQQAITAGPWSGKIFTGTLSGAARGQFFSDATYIYWLAEDNTPVRLLIHG